MAEVPVRFGDADLTDCDREPIHIPGSVQPHGALLALDPETLTVVMAGGSTERFLDASPSDLIGHNLDARLGGLELRRLDGLTLQSTPLPQPKLLVEAGLTSGTVEISACLSGGLLVLELEPLAEDGGLEGIELVQGMVRRLEEAASFESLTQAIVDQVQAVTGFDRVMLYRFQSDDSGHVIAEKRRSPDVESFLDLHYPASDIPVQARKLYLSSWIRHIPDATYTASPLSPTLNPKTGEPLDLSFCGLRSVSPVHLEYLANMGVAASTSLSLVVGGKLWGLVACHHREPHFLSPRLRASCELFAQLASLQLQNRLEIDLAQGRLKTRDIQSALISKAARLGLPDGLLGPEPTLLTLIPAVGVAVVAEGVLEVQGLTPDADKVPDLLAALNELVPESGVFSTERFTELTGIDLGGGIVGVLALAISREPKDYVLWFLPEQVQQVRWAGDPAKPMVSGPLGDRLAPRKSFESWTQTVKGSSRPWSPVEIEAAALLRISLLELVLRRVDQLARERNAARAHQDLLMAELDHRVKNSLATIQSMVRFSGRSAEDLVSFVNAIQNRLQSMAKTHNLLTQSRWEGASLRAIVEDELRAHTFPGGCEISVDGADFDLEPKAALATSMVIHELATNAIKHGCLADADGRLDITWELENPAAGGVLVIRWRETCSRAIAPPTRRGFGRTLLEQVFARDVGGAVAIDFQADGFKGRLEIPGSRVTQGQRVVNAPRPQDSSSGGGRLEGLQVLLVEDGALVAEDMAAWLRGCGASVLGPYSSLSTALQAAREHGSIDLALLDVDVDGQPIWSLAAEIRARGVPIIFTTGFSPDTERPPAFTDAWIVNKPYEFGHLQATIDAAMKGRAREDLADGHL